MRPSRPTAATPTAVGSGTAAAFAAPGVGLASRAKGPVPFGDRPNEMFVVLESDSVVSYCV